MKNILKINNLTYIFLLTSFMCGFIKQTLIIFGIVIFHELGHVCMALILKYQIINIEIFPFGGITKINSFLNDNIFKCLLISFGGILFQLIIIIFIKDPLILKYNQYLLLFNLLPIIPLDGSKIIFEILNLFFSHKKCISILCLISTVTIFTYGYFNFYYVLNNYMIIILFIYKTIIFYKNKNIYQSKFILERMLYDFGYIKIANNINIKDYKKNYHYYYLINNKIIDEKQYLTKLSDKLPK